MSRTGRSVDAGGPARVWRAMAVAFLALAGLAVPAAAEGTATLTLRATRSAYVDVTFHHGFTLHDATATDAGGAYRGYYLQPLTRSAADGFGQVWFASFRRPGFREAPIPIGGRGTTREVWTPGLNWTIPAGRYRVHVVGTHPVEVRLRVSGRLPARTLTATRPTRAAAAVRDLTLPVVERTAPAGAAAGEIPISIDGRALAFSSLYWQRRGTMTSAISGNTCIGRAGGVQCVGGSQWSRARNYEEFHTNTSSKFAESAGTLTTYYDPGRLPDGDHVGHFKLATTSMFDKVVGAVFTLSL